LQYADKTSGFENFFREYMKDELTRAEAQGEKKAVIDFVRLSKHNSELADAVLEEPRSCTDAAQDALDKLSFIDSDLTPRFHNLPASEFVKIRNLRSSHIGKLIGVKGIVKRASEVRPEVKTAIFECTNCGDRYEKEQGSTQLSSPYKCDCGNRNFEIADKNMQDVQIVTIEEDPQHIEGAEQPRKIGVYLRDELVDPDFQNRVIPGNKVHLSGTLREQEQEKDSKRYDLYIEGNYLEPVEREFEEIDINPEQEEELHKLANDDEIFDRIVSSIAPSIHGHTQVKKAVALQLFSGVRKERPDGTNTRGDLHVLLIGEPGTGKSQILQFTGNLAPKGKYVVGKAATAAGITATVMKDEITDEWTLEAGALVLANKGLATIDEIDKMSKEDRSSMHEAMEQQCFGPRTKVMLPDGTKETISDIVDPILADSDHKQTQDSGKEIAPADDLSVLSTDMETFQTQEAQVSVVGRRPAPDQMIRITLENGRTIEATPEHPFHQLIDGNITEQEAQELDQDSLLAAPARLPVDGEGQHLDDIETSPRQKDITLPDHNSAALARFTGYHVSDGGYELNRGEKAGVNFTNTDQDLIDDYTTTVRELFNIDPYIRERDDRKQVRVISRELVEWLETLDSDVLASGGQKKIPERLMKCKREDIRHLLRAFFDGDGGVYRVDRGHRIRAVVENRELLEQVQELLLRFGISSTLQQDGNVWRLDISRYSDIRAFDHHIGFLSSHKQERLREALQQERDPKEPVPGISSRLMELIQTLGIDQQDILTTNLLAGQNISRQRAQDIIDMLQEQVNRIQQIDLPSDLRELTNVRQELQISQRELADTVGVSPSLISHWEKNGTQRIDEYRDALERSINKRKELETELQRLEHLVKSIQWHRIRDIEVIEPDYDHVYDLTVPQTSTFLAETMVAHNSITISKASIQATLQCRTSILAAGNPKFGRFDPFQPIGDQIDISDTLLSRFDLIFPVRDIPERSKDQKLADHIMSMHTDPQEHRGKIEKEQLRKYIAYAKRNVQPKFTEEAEQKLKDFYVNTREQGSSGDGQSKVPITARQLEALIRLAEASAKTRLAEEIKEQDAQRAIDLLTYSLKQIGVIDDSGEFDIDKIETGMSTESRSKIQVITNIINELGGGTGDAVPIEDVLAQAEEEGLDEEEAEDVIKNLKREGELFEPKKGHIGKI